MSWCDDIPVAAAVAEVIRRRSHPPGIRRDTQRARRAEIEEIRDSARREVEDLTASPLWVAGTVMYWGEGGKTDRRLSLSNADPEAHRLFIAWVREFHAERAEFTLALHLHEGNDEAKARAVWAERLDLTEVGFHKTFIKPAGTGHRKNTLEHGVCRTYVRRSTDHFLRTMAWIEVLPAHLGFTQPRPGSTLPAGR